MSWCGVCEQGDSPDSMLQWVLSQSGQKVIKDPDLVKQVALAVLRQAIPHPKVSPCSPSSLPPCHAIYCSGVGCIKYVLPALLTCHANACMHRISSIACAGRYQHGAGSF